MALPSDATAKLWSVYKAPTNVLIETEDERTFIIFISEAKGNFFLFNGWSDVVTHLGLKTGYLVMTPLDSTRFKLTYFVNGVSPTCFWISMVPTASHFTVIPDCILPKSHDYTFTDLISTIHLGNKKFHVRVETFNGKVCFTNGIDVIVTQYQLEAGSYFLFTKWFGHSFHLRIFGKNGLEMNFGDVHVDDADIPRIDYVQDVALPVVAEQANEHIIRFVRTAADYFRLPDDVSRKAKLDFGLKSITIRLLHLNPHKEFPNGTRREKRGKGYRYALKRWSRFMNIAGIKVGETVYFCFDETEQVLSVERVVPPVSRS
ncbi:putative transcription factor B3-Domain family [Helianthus annuus]|nr:putative transcription factor B3-Domain family [Helianthus annuus]KAJ0943643.1 putative transcription factor B3-Domain family [Helianthus annuus]